MKIQTIKIQKVWYNSSDYKIFHKTDSPAGTLKEWKKWAKENNKKIKVIKLSKIKIKKLKELDERWCLK